MFMRTKSMFKFRSCTLFMCMTFLFAGNTYSQTGTDTVKINPGLDSVKKFNDENYSAEGFSVRIGKYIMLGGQANFVYQHQSVLSNVKYTGPVSIFPNGDDQLLTTITANVLLKFWKKGEFVISPEMQLGNGIGNGKGMGAYPNGLYGNPQNTPYLLRAHYRHHFYFKHSLLKEYNITIGRYALMEMFDMNPYASDPKKDFLNFAHSMLNAWDVAITAYGYTHGIAQSLKFKSSSISLSVNTHNLNAGGPETNWNIKEAHSVNMQFVQHFKLFGKGGKIRLIGFYNRYRGGDFKYYHKDSIRNETNFDSTHLDATKLGAGIELTYRFLNNSGLFLRYSFSDGLHEDFGYTQCDGSLNGGASFGMNGIKRSTDRFGICASVNTISALHQQYLKDGGTGFMVGDGNLSYAPETVFETYYCFDLWHHAYFTIDYQYALNVGYNADRGNAHFVGARLNLTL